jgi:hypothetical protein
MATKNRGEEEEKSLWSGLSLKDDPLSLHCQGDNDKWRRTNGDGPPSLLSASALVAHRNVPQKRSTLQRVEGMNARIAKRKWTLRLRLCHAHRGIVALISDSFIEIP